MSDKYKALDCWQQSRAFNSKLNTYDYSTVIEAFKDFLISLVGHAPNEIIPDGQGHRFSTDGKRGNKDGRYTLHLDGFKPAGYGECLRQNIKKNWKYSETTTNPLTPEQKKALYREIELKKFAETQRLALQHEQVAQRALSIWRKAEPASGAHAYLLKKQVHPYLARLNQEYLLIPLCDVQGKLWSLQYIALNGDKRFLKGGRKHGLFCSLNCKINELVKRDKVLICEGFATGATLASLEPNQAIMVAFDAGNLMPVVDALLGRFPDLSIEIIADNDRKAELKTGINTGVSKAQAVATKYPNVVVKVPTFPDDAPIELSDVNDLANWQQVKESVL